ncbi:MAG: GNAT family N-acetyltransferase [bacterium]
MIIRQFLEKDIKKIRSLIISVWDELYLDYFSRQDLDEKIYKSYSNKALIEELNNKNAYDILFEDGDEIIGICKSSFEPDKKILSVGELYLSKKNRGKGLGLKLIQNCIEKLSPDKIELETHYKNLKAQNFYLRLGFKILEERTKTWGKSSLHPLTLHKSVKSF